MNDLPNLPDQLQEGLDLLKQEDPSAWLDPTGWRFKTLLVLAALVLVLWMYRKLMRAIKRRRTPTLHPKLQKYGEGYGDPSPKLLAKRRAEAEKIVTTSSTPTVVGYDILEQVEAVLVDGFRQPEDAIEGLKAAAAMKGANAVTNVRQERAPSGKCSAAGDAVIVHKHGAIEAPEPVSDRKGASDQPQKP